MFFRNVLLEDASYRLTIVGQPRSGGATVRLTLGQSKPQWFPAPDGQLAVSLAAGQSVEVVVYSDAPYSYHLRNLELETCDRCALPSVFRGWQLEPYGALEWTSNLESVSVSGQAPASGMFFRRQLDPEKAYRLQVGGHPVSGDTTLRITTSARGPIWFPAPNGVKRLTVAASHSIEALIYGDAAYSYRLDAIAIEECAACLTDRQFARKINTQVPALEGLLDRDRKTAARALLNWTANVVNFAMDGNEEATARAHDMGPAEAYQELWSGHAGTGCGGFADFFAKVLTLFGFEAFTVDIGYSGTLLTHVTTVVVIDREFYVLDPTFNGAYIDTSGDLVRLERILKKPTPGDKRYAFRTSAIARDVFFAAVDEPTANALRSTLGVDIADCAPVRDQATGSARHVCRQVPYDAPAALEPWRHRLEELHLPWDGDVIRTLIRHHVISFSASDPALRQRFLQALSSHGIRVG